MLAWVASALASCHLADTPDAPKCEKGTHPNLGHCEADALSGPTITIASAGSPGACTSTPASITVVPNGDFRFQNDDSVDHVITGTDGQVWATALAHEPSPFIGITKVGTWPFQVSGCTGPGTVVVE